MPFAKHKTNGTYYTHKGKRYTPKQVRAYYATGGFRRAPRRRRRRV